MTRLWPLLACVILMGCSNFDADFERLGKRPAPQPAFLGGAWDGHWESHKGYGSGQLQAVIARDPAKQTSAGSLTATGLYDAHFKATWSGVLKAEYHVPIHATTDMSQLTTVKIRAEHDLGPGVGKYTMDGEATPSAFTSTYKSDYDEGIIELHRPQVQGP